jgi:hypothetical protein
MKRIEIHVHPVDFDAVRAYYRERGVHEPQLVLVPAPDRWIAEPVAAPVDRYAEL